jgi:predicted Co/Zn/Cd cation transporter (cation efflux family)
MCVMLSNHTHKHIFQFKNIFEVTSFTLDTFKEDAFRFMLIFMKILKMCLKVLFSETTKRKRFTNYQWHLQPTLITKKWTKCLNIALTALVTQ